MKIKKTAVVICPGRGTYGKAELGYLHKYHDNKKTSFDMKSFVFFHIFCDFSYLFTISFGQT